MTASNLPQEIRNKKLLAVEGDDDVGFFVQLLDKIKILDFFVLPVDGKGNFNEQLPLLMKISGFSKVTHFAIIRDRDENSKNSAFNSIADILRRKMDFQVIPSKHGEWSFGKPQIGIFIMPGDAIKGKALEDLCLKTVENHPAIKCVNEFISCACALETKPKNISKAKAQTFLAAQPEIVNSVGVGAQKNYWDFQSPALDELKQFLSNLK